MKGLTLNIEKKTILALIYLKKYIKIDVGKKRKENNVK